MLKLITHKKKIGFDPKTLEYRHLFVLEDSELGAIEIIAGADAFGLRPRRNELSLAINAVVIFYSSRNLDVMGNVLLFYSHTRTIVKSDDTVFINMPFANIGDFFSFCKEWVPSIKPYEEEIDKLLLMM